ncbi:3-ketoacyl-reductase [Dactylonectria macrodidyma]|uniref:3-ketoacyl-reductase n=1 Tax=Dactylonectria macrodidyma TaxID=307937 RepID=A0A9P9FAF2_9HYPO|nr:3-ketoacyl-reductase [Dactylonectria macrodidyma]
MALAGKHCAVVGATGIIGSHIARAFAGQGAVISLLGRSVVESRSRLEPLLAPYRPPPSSSSPEAVQSRSNSSVPSQHRFIRLDVSQGENIKDIFAGRDQNSDQDTTVGPVDILVNCAGISQTSFLKRTSEQELRDVLNTNLMATMLVCKHARVRSYGCIINVSSLMATKGGSGATAYAASKAGVVGFTRALCRELGPRSIRVNALLPGWVASPMWDYLKPELQAAFLKDTPLNRVGDPEEIADAAVFLASNAFANNCVLNLDGGLSAA